MDMYVTDCSKAIDSAYVSGVECPDSKIMNPSLASFTFYQRSFGTFFEPELYHSEGRLVPSYRTEDFGFTSGKNSMWEYQNRITTKSTDFYDDFFFSWKHEIINSTAFENHSEAETTKEDPDSDPYLRSTIRSDSVTVTT